MRSMLARAFVLTLLLAPAPAAATVACITDTDTGSCCCTADAAVCESMGGTASTEADAMRLCCHVDEVDAGIVSGGPDAGVGDTLTELDDAAPVSVTTASGPFDCVCACDGCEAAALVREPGFVRWLRAILSAVAASGPVSVDASAGSRLGLCLCRPGR